VRIPRLSTLLLFLPLALAPGCNRGAHPAQIGRLAPDFTVSDGATSVHLTSYRGRVVILNLWATWCGPCVAETPALLALHHERPELAIVAVSVDENPQAYADFIRRHHVDLITVRDPGQTVANLYHSTMWPESYIIDRQGVIRRKLVGAQDWSSPELRTYIQSL
jgi:peroxiredoxin